jgi:hypothetical protein
VPTRYQTESDRMRISTSAHFERSEFGYLACVTAGFLLVSEVVTWLEAVHGEFLSRFGIF